MMRRSSPLLLTQPIKSEQRCALSFHRRRNGCVFNFELKQEAVMRNEQMNEQQCPVRASALPHAAGVREDGSPNGMAEDGAQFDGCDAARVGEIDFVMETVEGQALRAGEIFHFRDSCGFSVVRTEVESLNARAFLEIFELHAGNFRRLTFLAKLGDGSLQFFCADKFRCANHQFPAPLLFRQFHELLVLILCPPKPLEFADGVILPGKFSAILMVKVTLYSAPILA